MPINSTETDFEQGSLINNEKNRNQKKEYHILSLSGGKDSTALAFFMRDNMPEIFEKTELVFADTECEILETYDYLNKIEIFLNKKITRIKPEITFEQYLNKYGFLPSIMARWCTIELKTKPFRKYLKNTIQEKKITQIHQYIGFRADEDYRGLKNQNKNKLFYEIYPFQKYGLNRQDIFDILIQKGIGIPEYYKYRKRSGCYFCFFQRKIDWIRLYENNIELFKKAMSYENYYNKKSNKRFGWCTTMPLEELIRPENIKIIKENHQKLLIKQQEKRKSMPIKLIDFFSADNIEPGCKMCHI